MRFQSVPFLANATPASGGGAALIQRTPVGRGLYVDPTATFSTNVTAGNTLIIYAATYNDGGITLTSSQGDTIVQNVATVGASTFKTILGYVASAIGGATTFTLGGCEASSIYVEEWENIAFDSAAGIGSIFGSAPQTASTPNSTTVANAVSFTVWTVWEGVDYSAQTVPSGWTEGARYTDGPSYDAYGQLIGAYRIETATGVKDAIWPDPEISGDYIGAQIMVFGET